MCIRDRYYSMEHPKGKGVQVTISVACFVPKPDLSLIHILRRCAGGYDRARHLLHQSRGCLLYTSQGLHPSTPPVGASLRVIPCNTAAQHALLPGSAVADISKMCIRDRLDAFPYPQMRRYVQKVTDAYAQYSEIYGTADSSG